MCVMVNGSSILVFVLIQKRFVGEVVHRLQAEQGVVEVVVVGFDILQGGDALTGRECGIPLEEICKNNPDSRIIVGTNKDRL